VLVEFIRTHIDERCLAESGIRYQGDVEATGVIFEVIFRKGRGHVAAGVDAR
jgi:hypothetical protein